MRHERVDVFEKCVHVPLTHRHPYKTACATDCARKQLPVIYSRELVDVIFEQPYSRIGNLVDRGIAKRQAASRYLY